MREIKFRAWDKKNKLMYYQTGKHADTPAIILWNKYYIHLKDAMNDKKYILMQYTGLKDKNVKEIYEGDVVEYKVPYSKKLKIAEVKWNDDMVNAGWLPFCIPIDYDEIYMDEFEVIGNIYENPELVKDME